MYICFGLSGKDIEKLSKDGSINKSTIDYKMVSDEAYVELRKKYNEFNDNYDDEHVFVGVTTDLEPDYPVSTVNADEDTEYICYFKMFDVDEDNVIADVSELELAVNDGDNIDAILMDEVPEDISCYMYTVCTDVLYYDNLEFVCEPEDI